MMPMLKCVALFNEHIISLNFRTMRTELHSFMEYDCIKLRVIYAARCSVKCEPFSAPFMSLENE